MKEEWDRWPRWLGDYTYTNLNAETLSIASLSAIQYVWALYRLIREVIILDPTLGPIYVMQADGSDGFYSIGPRPTDAPKLVLVFPQTEAERIWYQYHSPSP